MTKCKTSEFKNMAKVLGKMLFDFRLTSLKAPTILKLEKNNFCS